MTVIGGPHNIKFSFFNISNRQSKQKIEFFNSLMSYDSINKLATYYIILMNRAIHFKTFFRIVNNPQPWFSPREKVIRVLYEQTRLCGVDSTKLKKSSQKVWRSTL